MAEPSNDTPNLFASAVQVLNEDTASALSCENWSEIDNDISPLGTSGFFWWLSNRNSMILHHCKIRNRKVMALVSCIDIKALSLPTTYNVRYRLA